jgi:hypothetical protein
MPFKRRVELPYSVTREVPNFCRAVAHLGGGMIIGGGKPKKLAEKALSQCHTVHHRFCMASFRTEDEAL